MKAQLRFVAAIAVICLGQTHAQNSFVLNLGNQEDVETIKSSMLFSASGVSATARSWSVSRSDSNAKLAESEIVQWGPGIGSKNSTETITNVPYVPYYVDNEDHYDFILFVFDQKIDITSLSLNPSGNNFDTDVSYWFGNVNTNITLTGKLLSELGSLGLGNRMDNDTLPSTNSRSFNITGEPPGGVNALLVGARVSGDADFDRYKLSTIQGKTIAVVPEPASAGLLVLGFALACMRRRR